MVKMYVNDDGLYENLLVDRLSVQPNSEKTKQLFASLHERLGKRESKASENPNKRDPTSER